MEAVEQEDTVRETTDDRILWALAASDAPLSTKELVEQTGRCETAVRRAIVLLIEDALIVVIEAPQLPGKSPGRARHVHALQSEEAWARQWLAADETERGRCSR